MAGSTTGCAAMVQYSDSAREVLSFFPAFSDAVSLLRDECKCRPSVVVTVETDHPHGITALGLFSGDSGFSVDTQSSRNPSQCMFAEEVPRHQLGSWKASVPMSLDAIFAGVYGHVLPMTDDDVDMSEIQDCLLKAADGVPFRASMHGINRVFQKLVMSPGRPCEGLGVMYQAHRPERARMLFFQPLVCKLYAGIS